ncbi:MAG: hypothetical protein CO108_24305 [Deltaproteobacteria bacterium CG_4_9_14_3_um_filter_63_12]|nr:MAG: hypothetical protein COW42_06550 [Deltaproteobacteria bacterium CG17_big_fil_post_rev_8_21_14_2_50_63_7]PJB36044.1 MAG: hypothetical protein CO108_24305 [Deltaproteobacteria bacterium CG_4_9_14_3_um_filter_63_12]
MFTGFASFAREPELFAQKNEARKPAQKAIFPRWPGKIFVDEALWAVGEASFSWLKPHLPLQKPSISQP